MRTRSIPSALLNLAALVLLGALYGTLLPFTADPYQMAKPGNAPSMVENGEVTEEKPPKATPSDDRGIDVSSLSTEEQVRYLFYRSQNSTCTPREEYQQLIAIGEKAFPTYEKILSDSEAATRDVSSVLSTLSYVQADRRRFLKNTVARLKDPDFGIRSHAVALLYQIGSDTEAPAVVPLLTDKECFIVHWAAKTLAAIGGRHELEALDKWVRDDNTHDNPELREHVQKCRDELKKRLEEEKDPKKRAEKIQKCWKWLRFAERDYPGIGRVVQILTEFGNETVAFLKDRVHPVPAATQKHFDQLLADLDSDSFKCRETATRELTRGEVAESVLEQALAHSPSAEQKRRLEAILEKLPEWTEKNPELLRQVRAVWVLQQIGSPEAKSLLEKIAAGALSARLTQKAKDALESLKKQK